MNIDEVDLSGLNEALEKILRQLYRFQIQVSVEQDSLLELKVVSRRCLACARVQRVNLMGIETVCNCLER